MKPLATRFAEWSHALQLESVPADVRREALRCIVDVTGVALAGSALGTAQVVRRLAVGEAPGGSARVWGTPLNAPPASASLANATAAHVLDFDDTCYDGIVHGSAAVWPAVLACAEFSGASGTQTLEAFIAGVEVEYALGRALPESVYYDGWWTSGVFGAIGAATGAAKAIGLCVDQTANAISLAVCQAAGIRGLLGTDAKPYAMGRAARTGVEAAQFAQAGLGAPVDAFESDRGFIKLFARSHFDEVRLSLGERYSLVDPGIAYKLYPACSAVQAATETVLQFVSRHDLRPEDIAAIECDVTPLVAISLTYDQPASATQAQFSLPYALACAVLYRDFGVLHIREPRFHAPEVKAIMRLVKMRRDDALESTELGRQQNPEGARVTVRLRDGRLLQSYSGAATGMPQRPMSDELLDSKFIGCATTALSDESAQVLLSRLRTLPQCADLRDFWT